MKLQLCKQMMTMGLVLVILAAAARLAPLTPAARMADNLALLASGLLVVLAAAVGWRERRRDEDPTTRPKTPHPQPSNRASRPRARSAGVVQQHHHHTEGSRGAS